MDCVLFIYPKETSRHVVLSPFFLKKGYALVVTYVCIVHTSINYAQTNYNSYLCMYIQRSTLHIRNV